MLKTALKSLISASFCVAMMVPASAVPLQNPVTQITGSSDVVQVRHQKRRGYYRHNNHSYYNGHRGYRNHRRGYRRHNGYWFPPAAFALGAIIGGAMNNNNYNGNVRPGYTNPQHVSWCHNKYRSYDQRSNTFQPYHGPRRECRSPYY
ncbi:BA14K family protein [Hoeflea ulvae]|uniref:Lectin-like protein BA14k n=1 Tax=Hoeflea ulvae TaxID=2983764 RepID=A0ABT3YE05_9HYPH|nr:BA14K family protein [Hoeflea ulvae]MCY0093902.1 BA14K family protein [Hoeflea ulvae]